MSTGDASSLRNSSAEGIYRREWAGGGAGNSRITDNRASDESAFVQSAPPPSPPILLFITHSLRLLEISGGFGSSFAV